MIQAEIEQLLQESPDVEMLTFRDGQYLIRQGETQTDVYVVINGAFVVEQARTDASDAVQGHLAAVMVEPERPCFVGEMAWLGSFPRTASVRSSGRLQALRLSTHHMETILTRFPDLTRSLCRQFAERLKAANEQLIAYQSEKLMKTAIQIKSPGDIVLTGGHPAQTLYQLVEGEVLLEGCGEPVAADAFPEGFLYPHAFLTGGTWPRTVTAGSGTILVAIDESSKLALIRNYPQVLLAELRALSSAPRSHPGAQGALSPEHLTGSAGASLPVRCG